MAPAIPLRIFLIVLSLAMGAHAAPPTVQTLNPAAGANVGSLTSISVTFSEAVSGLDEADLLINNEPAAAVSGSGAGPYVFTFTEPAVGGVSVQWDTDHGITNLGGELFAGGAWSYTLTDTTAPVVRTLTPAAGSTVGPLTQVEVLFSENVSGMNATDLLINGAPAATASGSGQGPYVFTFPQPGVGTVNFAWAAGHGIVDASAIAFAGGSWSVTRSASGAGNLVINEFLAANISGLADENSEVNDWIEIQNNGAGAVSLAGWALTNDEDDLARWVFPSWTLNAGNRLVIFASAKDRRPAQAVAGQDNPGTVAQPRLHANFKLNPAGSYLALVGPESPRAAVSHFTPEFPEQRNNYSYGVATGGVLRYFATPSPGVANGASSLTSITPRPSFSVGRGLFSESFSLVMSCSLAGATIRYTTDGSEPTATTGTLYGGPITISTTTILRAAAFATDRIPSETVTHSYIFLDHVLTQPASPAGFPSTWGREGTTVFSPASTTPGEVPADYEMDPEIVNDPTYTQMLKDGLRALPVLSIVCKQSDLFAYSNDGVSTNDGIYTQPTLRGAAFERPASVEWLERDGGTLFVTTCGIQIQGNASRTPSNNPKHAFKLDFKGDYGPASLDVKLFTDSAAEKFDDIVLRADYNTSWRHWDPTQRSYGSAIRDPWMKDSMRAMGGLASHSNYVHLFLNGLYWGIYDPTEQPVGQFAENYLGGDKKNFDVANEENVANYAPFIKGGDATVYNQMVTFGRAQATDFSLNATYETMKGYVEMTQFIDYMLLHFFVGHQDWGVGKNWYSVRRRVAGEGFRYVPWDGENIMMNTGDNRVSGFDDPTGLHRTNTYRNTSNVITAGNLERLSGNAEYRLNFADRVHRHLVAPDGALTPAANIARWQQRQAELDTAMVAESARWGDYRRDVHVRGAAVLYTRNGSWLTEMNRIAGASGYFSGRTNTVLNQLRNNGIQPVLYPTLNAAEFRKNSDNTLIGSANVPAGFQLKMVIPSPPGGTNTIYFTTDGQDPRVAFSGAVNTPSAQAYTAPIAINATTTVKARVLNATTWSALNEATFTVGAGAIPIAITEIMYNPPGGAAHEFIELQNYGTREVTLGGCYFDGIEFMFPFGFTLGAGARVVVASNENPAAFATQYPGVSIAGHFGGSLDNGGERLALKDPGGATIVAVVYDDGQDLNLWPTSPDGGGFSLEIVDPAGDPSSPLNWKPSNAAKGTAGLANSPRLGGVEISEVMAANVAAVSNAGLFSEYVELRNTTGADIVIAGWKLQLTSSSFIFHAGTTVPASSFLVIWLDNASGGTGIHAPSTQLGPEGGFVQLLNGFGAGAAVVDAVEFGAQVTDKSIGRVAGSWVLTNASPNMANTPATLAPATNLVINEFLANNLGGTDTDWIEFHNRHATLPAALHGTFVKVGVELFPVRLLAFVAPTIFVRINASEGLGLGRLPLTLPAEGSTLALLASDGVSIDALTYGAQTAGMTSGRFPDGAANVVSFGYNATPGASNVVVTYNGPRLNELLVRNVGADLAPWGEREPWVELHNPNGTPFDLAGRFIGDSPTLTGNFLQFPAPTSIPGDNYITVWLGAPPAGGNVPPGTLWFVPTLGNRADLYLFDAAQRVVDSIEFGSQATDFSIGKDAGTWKLLAAPTRNLANSAPATLGAVTALRINEWRAAGGVDFLELYNVATAPVELSGLYLTDDPAVPALTKTQIPPLSYLGAKSWVEFKAAGGPVAGEMHVDFALDAAGDFIRLSATNLALIDAVSFGAQTTGVSEGRILDGDAVQAGLTPTPGARNVLPPAPTIGTHPPSQTVLQGANVGFNVTANGSAPLTYQWRFNGADIAGATAASLSLTNVTTANYGDYTVVVTNTAGSATSNVATLTVQQTLAQWAASFGLSGADASAGADPDRDGIPNIAELFHNMSPTGQPGAADRAALPQVGIEPATGTPQFLTLTYRQNPRAAVSLVEHQVSATLATGSFTTVAPDVTEQLGPDPQTGDPRVRVKFAIPPGDTRRFGRLRLTE